MPVNVGIARADVMPEPFLYVGKPLQRRLALRPGDAVRCRLRPVDPEVVPVPDDVLESAATQATRARRIEALLRELA